MSEEKKHRILIVDDDKLSGELLSKRLVRRDFEVEYIESGKLCLEYVETKKDDFDLILLDIMMPEISGVEVLEEIRKTVNNFELPIIMVTSKDEADDIVGALKKGANDYLVKPVNIDIAIARIQTQLNIKDLVSSSIMAKQISTINTMVATLNHEINNPLAIAVGNLSIPYEKINEERVKKSLGALDRIAKIVKQIDEISGTDMEEVKYSTNINIYKLDK